jgi:hypothetical protein
MKRIIAPALALSFCGSLWFSEAPQRVRVLSNHEIAAVTGRNITQWGNAWWKWAFDNPDVLFDVSGEFSHLGDVRGRVFFAQGSGGDPVNASVDVPRGEYVLLPVATYVWTFFDPCAEPRCARRIINENFLDGFAHVSVWIDGRPVRDLESHLVRVDRRNPAVFSVDAGPIGPDGYGGILPALQGGYWLMLAPLPPGRHSVVFRAVVPDLDPFTGEPTGGTVELFTRLTLR